MKCKDYIHPFQHDPGTSQAQRVMDELLSGAEKIDSRTLADLLDYFVQLSKQINYYDENLGTRDWQPFFRDSLPFTITSMLKFKQVEVGNKIAKYRKKFNYRPSKATLQTLIKYEYRTLIIQLNTWYQQVRNNGLIIEGTLQNLITKNGQEKVKAFITCANNAARYFRIKAIDFSELVKDDSSSNVWGLVNSDLYKSDSENDFHATGTTRRQRLINLYNSIADLSTTFINIIHSAMGAAEMSLTASFENLREDLKQRYTPHHALLFAFLKLFRHLQDELNQYTRKHLDFFYQEVLKLVPRKAVADHAHIVFEIQKALDTYPLKAGLPVKDSKDSNKEDILFALDEDIVVNKAQVKDVRTLFINNEFVQDDAYVQGVYMAPVATKADGIDKDFPDDQPNKSWPTVGSHLSKYIDPENKFVHPYPNARIAFVMASPVLLLSEGTRKVTMVLDCILKQNHCLDIVEKTASNANPCCDDVTAGSDPSVNPSKEIPRLYNPGTLFNDVKQLLNGRNVSTDIQYSTDGLYYYINRDLIAQAVKLGISKDVKDVLENFLTIKKTRASDPKTICYCEENVPLFEATITSDLYTAALPKTDPAYTLLLPIFPPQRALKISFSGEKDWIIPKQPSTFSFATTGGSPDILFQLTIESNLDLNEPGVTFYNVDALKEEIDTVLPVVKVELNDKIKLLKSSTATADESCCFRLPGQDKQEVSAYHFFRNVLIGNTTISVSVCGLKNFVVQNDESLQDVNKPIYPFGTRPAIVDFDINDPPPAIPPPNLNLVGPNFYIGSQEVFCKSWDNVCINLMWKDKPTDFNDYYKAYIKRTGYHDCSTPPVVKDIFGLNECEFQVNMSLLDDGKWNKESGVDGKVILPSNPFTNDFNRELFIIDDGSNPCNLHPAQTNPPFLYSFKFDNTDFGVTPHFGNFTQKITKYDVNSKSGFLRIQLQNQDFLHKDYSYVLARQMMALGKLPNQAVVNAVYYNSAGDPIVFDTNAILQNLQKDKTVADFIDPRVSAIHADANIAAPPGTDIPGSGTDPADDIRGNLTAPLANPYSAPDNTPDPLQLKDASSKLAKKLGDDIAIIGGIGAFQAIIPNEPWTPIIQNISIDYVATATSADISLIHLYPYQNTYKKEELQLEPAMFPTFCDEGTLYIGLENLVQGSNVSFLFQLAEATSDTEDDLEPVHWHYLDNNTWKELRTGFEVVEDKTNNLSTSGIVKIAMPGNISNTNTVLPAGLYWIKATIGSNSGIISETIAIHTQAVRATFTNTTANDKLRLGTPLTKDSLTKLNEADASIKSVKQPYDSFGGRIPESESYFYVRVSEMLRHKGRAIQKFDYERLALDICPQVFKAKCINHSFGLNAHRYINDYPMAPGYVLLAVIPDFTKINASGSSEPRLPLSMLEEIETKLRSVTSPFVRLRAMNPRYEKVDFCLRVKLIEGKDENFYKEQLKKDIGTFMAPWAVGSFDKLDFGQVINRSDFIRFLERQNYIDYITEFLWRHDEDELPAPIDQPEIFPLTPRSILIAGHIDVCILSKDCPDWDKPGTEIFCENKPDKIVDYCNDILK